MTACVPAWRCVYVCVRVCVLACLWNLASDCLVWELFESESYFAFFAGSPQSLALCFSKGQSG